MDNNYQNMTNTQPVNQQTQPVSNLQNNSTQINQPIPTVNNMQSTTIQQPTIVTENNRVDGGLVPPVNSNPVPNSVDTKLEFDLPSVSNETVQQKISVNQEVEDQNLGTMPIQEENISHDGETLVQDSSSLNEVVSTKTYLGYIFLYSIPLIGFLILIINSFQHKNANIKNYSKAYLLFLILILLFILIIYFVAVFVLKFSFNN